MPVATRTASILGLLFGAAALFGCEDSFVSETEQIRFWTDDLRTGVSKPFVNDRPVLEGTRVCPTSCASTLLDEEDPNAPLLSCGDGFANSDIFTCFRQTAFRGEVDEDNCITVTGPDTTAWFFTPIACAVSDFWAVFQPQTDYVQFRVTAVDDVEASFEQWPEDAADAMHDAGYLVKHTGGGFGEDWRYSQNEPVRVLAGEPVLFSVQLTHRETGEQVAYDASTSEITVVTTAGPEAEVTDGVTAGTVTIKADVWTEASVFLTVGQTRNYLVGEVVGIPAGRLDSIEIIAAMEDELQTDDWGPPMGARAVVRDMVGRVVLGVPVEWDMERGELAVGSDEELIVPGPDYVSLADTCLAKAKHPLRREATLIATYNDLEAEAELGWTPDLGPDYQVNLEHCKGSCSGCSASTPAAPALGLVLAAMVGTRRRRVT